MEMVELIPVTRAHALEKQETKKMDRQLGHVAEKGLKLDMIQTYFSSISWVAFQLFQVICLGFTGYLASQGKISGISNIVFMGMGEPFLNTPNVMKAIRFLNHPKMRGLGARHITISTSGIVPGIKSLIDFELPIRLSVSLHATNDALRSKLMPVNRQYPLPQLMDALKLYKKRTGG